MVQIAAFDAIDFHQQGQCLTVDGSPIQVVQGLFKTTKAEGHVNTSARSTDSLKDTKEVAKVHQLRDVSDEGQIAGYALGDDRPLWRVNITLLERKGTAHTSTAPPRLKRWPTRHEAEPAIFVPILGDKSLRKRRVLPCW